MEQLPIYAGGTEVIQLQSDEKPTRWTKKVKIQLVKDYIKSIGTGVPLEIKKRDKFINSVGNHFNLGLCWAD